MKKKKKRRLNFYVLKHKRTTPFPNEKILLLLIFSSLFFQFFCNGVICYHLFTKISIFQAASLQSSYSFSSIVAEMYSK